MAFDGSLLVADLLLVQYVLEYEASERGRGRPPPFVVIRTAHEVLLELKRMREQYVQYCDGLLLLRRPPLILIDDLVAECEDGLPTEEWKGRVYDLLMKRLLERLYAGAKPYEAPKLLEAGTVN